MGKSLTVILSHSNQEFVNVCSETLKKYGFNVITIFNDGLLLLNRIISDSPDVVLMDAFMITFNAIDVLHSFKKVKGIEPPIFFVLSTECDDHFISKHLESGADYYFPLPFDYDILVARIALYKNIDLNVKIPRVAVTDTCEKNQIYIKISQILNKAGIPSNNIGYTYLRASIYLAIKDPSQLNPISQKLFPSIAKEFNTTQASVIRAMQYAIKTSRLNSSSTFWYDIFEDSVPSVSKFISVVIKTTQSKV